MAVCERCRHDNPAARESCARCGWYLRWELTGPEAFNETGGGAVQLTVPAGTIAVTLDVPGIRCGLEDPIELGLSPGGELALAARVRNEGASAQRFDVSVEGLPESWWSVEPRALHLPSGECKVAIRLHPPLSALAEARRWPFWVEVTPNDGSPGGRSAIAGLTLDTYRGCVATLEPRRRAGRGAAHFTVRLRNHGNTHATVRLHAREDGGECRCRCDVQRLALGPGEDADVRVTVRPPRRIVFGRPVDRDIRIDVSTDQADALPELVGTYQQRPLLSRWRLAAVLVLALALALALTTRDASVRVPSLTGLPGAAQAEDRLEDAGLRLEPHVRRHVDPDVVPGTVVEQIPPAGVDADKGDAVSIVVAAPTPEPRLKARRNPPAIRHPDTSAVLR